jgi:lysozyme
MKTSIRGLAEIAGHEGIVLKPYLDSVGVWTIGIGHTAAAGPPNPKGHRPLTIEEAMSLFGQDIEKFEADVCRAVKVDLAQHEFDALVSFHFNTGAIGKAKLVKLLNSGDRAGAAAAFLNYSRPKEIISRRTREMDLFLKGRYGDGTASILDANARGRINWKSIRPVNVLEAMLKAAPERNAPAEMPLEQPIGAKRGDRNSEAVRILQRNLQRLKFDPGPVDGDFGDRTTAALGAFQRAHICRPEEVNATTAAEIVQALSSL